MNAPVESVPPNVHKFAKKLIVFEWFLSAVPYILAASLSDMPHLRCLAIATSFYHRLMGIGQGFPAFCPSAPIPPTTASFTIHFALSTFHSSAYFLLSILRLSSSVFLARGGKEEFFLICFAMLCFVHFCIHDVYIALPKCSETASAQQLYGWANHLCRQKRRKTTQPTTPFSFQHRIFPPKPSMAKCGQLAHKVQAVTKLKVGSWRARCSQSTEYLYRLALAH